MYQYKHRNSKSVCVSAANGMYKNNYIKIIVVALRRTSGFDWFFFIHFSQYLLKTRETPSVAGSDDERMVHGDGRQRGPVVHNRVHGDSERFLQVYRTEHGGRPSRALDLLREFPVQEHLQKHNSRT